MLIVLLILGIIAIVPIITKYNRTKCLERDKELESDRKWKERARSGRQSSD